MPAIAIENEISCAFATPLNGMRCVIDPRQKREDANATKKKNSSNNAIGGVLHCMNCPSNLFISNAETFCQENYSTKSTQIFVHQNKNCQPLMHDFVRCLNGSAFSLRERACQSSCHSTLQKRKQAKPKVIIYVFFDGLTIFTRDIRHSVIVRSSTMKVIMLEKLRFSNGETLRKLN